MLYDRKIKYVDYYENGERVKGAGFVKLEVRDGLLKMDLNIRGLYPTDSFVRDVILKGLETEAVLGQISLQEGVGCFRFSCDMIQGIGSTGISYEELQEIKIPVGGSRELRCTWNKVVNKTAGPVKTSLREGIEQENSESGSADQESTVEMMEVQEPEVQEAEIPQTEGQDAKLQEMELQEIEAQEIEAQEIEAQEIEAQEIEAQEIETQEVEVQKVKVPEAKGSALGAQNMEAAAVESPHKESQKAEDAGKLSREIQMFEIGHPQDQIKTEQKPAVKLLEDKWQQLSAIYPHIKPFGDEREYLSLSPSDFVMFPESYYRAANNSFLLHGFYNYKHLVLARVERRGEVRYYLGVPGNYYEREKQVAVMFGFESFECDREPAKTGDFGYYLMRMEL